jgi:hypothetical protein
MTFIIQRLHAVASSMKERRASASFEASPAGERRAPGAARATRIRPRFWAVVGFFGRFGHGRRMPMIACAVE